MQNDIDQAAVDASIKEIQAAADAKGIPFIQEYLQRGVTAFSESMDRAAESLKHVNVQVGDIVRFKVTGIVCEIDLKGGFAKIRQNDGTTTVRELEGLYPIKTPFVDPTGESHQPMSTP